MLRRQFWHIFFFLFFWHPGLPVDLSITLVHPRPSRKPKLTRSLAAISANSEMLVRFEPGPSSPILTNFSSSFQ
ncbi:hypothetical protein DFH06DRAFT_1180148 [Mycena polygramma]|nr:hypothetical protein DFH06DRAFT_1180148 [Mycena polygramma]